MELPPGLTPRPAPRRAVPFGSDPSAATRSHRCDRITAVTRCANHPPDRMARLIRPFPRVKKMSGGLSSRLVISLFRAPPGGEVCQCVGR
jgi:hypothetical protein